MIRVGIIGYGYMGQFHKKKIVQSGQARVVAILDKEQRRREEGLSDGYHVYSEKQLETFSKKLRILSSWQLKLKNVHIMPLRQ